MITTANVDLVANQWTKLSDGDANVLVQSPFSPIRAGVFQSQPNAPKVGHILDGPDRTAAFSSLEAGDQVWAFSPFAITIIVTK